MPSGARGLANSFVPGIPPWHKADSLSSPDILGVPRRAARETHEHWPFPRSKFPAPSCGVQFMKQRSLVLAVTFLLVVASVSAAVAAPEQNSFLSNGVKIHYVTDGQGEPVVLIHGFSANAYVNWMLPGVFAKLSKHYHVIAL